MKKINHKEIISKSCKRMINDFNNFARIVSVVFIVTTPIYLFSAYYDEYVLDIYNQKGMIASMRGSGLTKILNWFVLFPITSAFLANWHSVVVKILYFKTQWFSFSGSSCVPHTNFWSDFRFCYFK